MHIVIKDGDEVLAEYSLDQEEEEVVIGSEPGCKIHLEDVRVRERHAVIRFTDEGTWELENLEPGDQDALTVNAQTLNDTRELHHGDEVMLHDYLLAIEMKEEVDPTSVRWEEPRLGPEQLAKIKDYPLPAGAMVKRHTEHLSLTAVHLDRTAEMGMDFANCRDLHELIEVALNRIIDMFHARAAWIGIRRKPEGELEVQGGRLRSGEGCETNPILEKMIYRCVDRAQHICIRKVRDHDVIGTAMGVPLAVQDGTLGMIYVDRPRRTRRFQTADLDLLSAVATLVAARLDAIVNERRLRSAAVEDVEVAVVHEIQAQLDPKSAPIWEKIQLAAYSRSGQENPGDVYDIMQHPDLAVTSFVLGHVNARGASLALSMARLHSTFRVGFLHKDRPHALARALAWLMHEEKDPATVDALFLMLDPNNGKIEYARGGKIGAFIVNPNGEPRPLQGADAPAIGQAAKYEYRFFVDQIEPGGTLVLYTRGVATCTNGQGERFGEMRFIQSVCDSFGELPSTIVQDVSTELTNFFGDGRHPDDITILLLHHNRPKKK